MVILEPTWDIINGAKEVTDRSASTVGEAANSLRRARWSAEIGWLRLNCSQIFKASKDKDELDGAALRRPSSRVEVAYKAVMKPVEGTILTVSRGAAIGAVRKKQNQPMMQ